VTQQEIAPIYTDERAVLSDNGLRPDSSLEKLGKLQTLFDKKTGSVTAGNASQITDGAVALLVTSEAKASELGMEPLGYLKGYAVTGCDPKRMGIGPVQAIAAANKKTGQELSDADVIEINEAFAAQVLAVLKALKDPNYAVKAGLEAPLGEITAEQLNPRGGAIALGHPVGATGARLVLSALKQLQASKRKRALVSVCIGGGQGTALWLER
jgi:acetyl-CoA C-acetyltransferase/acetyl-CoA acyltransferase